MSKVAPTQPASSADSLMRKRSVTNCLAAADIYEAAAAGKSGAAEVATLKLKAADAINCAMRIQTSGNILVIEGTSDSPANKRFWDAHGGRALGLVREAMALQPSLQSAPLAMAVEVDAFMYACSAKGIVKQALTGAGVEFKRMIDRFAATHAQWEEGLPHCYVGGFFNAAPWPLGDKRRALDEMRSALALGPRSRRNNYYVCLLTYQQGGKAEAVPHCEAALRASCNGIEADYCAAMTAEVHRVLGLARK